MSNYISSTLNESYIDYTVKDPTKVLVFSITSDVGRIIFRKMAVQKVLYFIESSMYSVYTLDGKICNYNNFSGVCVNIEAEDKPKEDSLLSSSLLSSLKID